MYHDPQFDRPVIVGATHDQYVSTNAADVAISQRPYSSSLDDLAKVADFDLYTFGDDEFYFEEDEPVRLEFYAPETGSSEVVHAATVGEAVRVAFEYIAEDRAVQEAEALKATANERAEMVRDLNESFGLSLRDIDRLTGEERPANEASPSLIDLDLAWQRGYDAGHSDLINIQQIARDLPEMAYAAGPFDDDSQEVTVAYITTIRVPKE